MTMAKTKLFDLYKVLVDQSYTVFSSFNSLITDATPFDTNDDIDYFLAHSSHKYLSSFFWRIMEMAEIDDIENITSTELNLIFQTIGKKFGNKWNRLYQALVVTTYEPDENYNMEEIMSGNNQTATSTDTETWNYSKRNETDTSKTIENSEMAFNSSSYVNTSKGVESNKGAQSKNYQKVQTDGQGNVTTHVTEQTPYKLTRHGNIGVTTNQQMIEQEIELRKTVFKEIVYQDVDSMLASYTYFN
jgi:hypothetical protein